MLIHRPLWLRPQGAPPRKKFCKFEARAGPQYRDWGPGGALLDGVIIVFTWHLSYFQQRHWHLQNLFRQLSVSINFLVVQLVGGIVAAVWSGSGVAVVAVFGVVVAAVVAAAAVAVAVAVTVAVELYFGITLG